MKTQLSGSCLCKAVTYHLDTPPLYVANCHCSECRKFSGAAFTTVLGAALSGLSVHCLDPRRLQGFDKSPATRLIFCGACGSSLFAEKPRAGLVHVRVGTLDQDAELRPQAHIHVASKASWYDLPADGLPRFQEGPPHALVQQAMRTAEQSAHA